MTGRGDVRLGGGPAISMYSFHGRGTLNGTIPHPALVALFESDGEGGEAAATEKRAYRRADGQFLCAAGGEGIAAIDVGFPARYTHSSLEVCDLGDLEQLTRLLIAALQRIDAKFSLDRDDFIQ